MSTMCADIFDNTGEIRLGGEALNFAMHMREFSDIHVSLMGAIGDDEAGKKIIEVIKNSPIDRECVHVISGGKTASNRIYLTQEGDRYFKNDSWDGGVYQEFSLLDADRQKLKDTDLVYINYYSPNLKEILRLKESYGYQLAIDFDVVRDFEHIEEIIAHTDYIFFSGDKQTLDVMSQWSKKYPAIFNVTLGEKGSVTFYRGKARSIDAFPVKEVVDTTGCGDSYHAAFLASYLRDKDIMKAMILGSRIASATLQHIGGF